MKRPTAVELEAVAHEAALKEKMRKENRERAGHMAVVVALTNELRHLIGHRTLRNFIDAMRPAGPREVFSQVLWDNEPSPHYQGTKLVGNLYYGYQVSLTRQTRFFYEVRLYVRAATDPRSPTEVKQIIAAFNVQPHDQEAKLKKSSTRGGKPTQSVEVGSQEWTELVDVLGNVVANERKHQQPPTKKRDHVTDQSDVIALITMTGGGN